MLLAGKHKSYIVLCGVTIWQKNETKPNQKKRTKEAAFSCLLVLSKALFSPLSYVGNNDSSFCLWWAGIKANWHRARSVSRLWRNSLHNVSNYLQLLQRSAMSKPVVSSGFAPPWQASPADWNLLVGLITHVCAEPLVIRAADGCVNHAVKSVSPECHRRLRKHSSGLASMWKWGSDDWEAPPTSPGQHLVSVSGQKITNAFGLVGHSFTGKPDVSERLSGKCPFPFLKHNDFWHCWFRRLLAITLEIQVLYFFPH